jgi:nucleoside permease NupC
MRTLINLLAGLFRGLSFIFGISAPPPEQDQRSFVLMWLGILVFIVAVAVLLFYLLSRLHVS